ncbi:MucR family transcriptional regulator [Mesorhizobium sp. 131-3-5]|uniref:MucR family transcriptional regulator n=1 Tax=Mesorhizobium sp. 131-3-5 TaxID=2744520 RepID=UPI0019275932|nr:MucR family transcriptional regulator [Mesorhizobium sp. 131-3-5]BCH12016.1 MucR family transcriptional regulator [Mesorhizobium sp. 131-3-5]
MEDKSLRLIELTAGIVSAYVANNPVPVGQLPDLIASVSGAVNKLDAPAIVNATAPKEPAVNPKKSILPDHIICLEDGKKFKSLKRHLRTEFGMTPDEYRAKWNLPADYPMVSPNYSATRSALAKSSGLGRHAKVVPIRAKAGARRAFA